MDDENEVVVPETTTEEVVTPEVTEEAPAEPAEEEVDWRSEAEKAKKLADNYKIRAEKAEKKVKETVVPQEQETKLSPADLLALMKAEVHEDDMGRVEKFAKMEGISIREALKSDELQAILSVQNEKRSTAKAANVSNVRRGPAAVSEDVLLSNAALGKLPDSDADIERLIAAKAKQK